MTGGYRREIDGLRALAVLAVVAFHARVPGFSGGFTGVDIFLVISGYLIGGLILREADAGSFTLIGFYERRIRRILPALLAMLAVSALLGFILLPRDFKTFGVSLTSATTMLSNFFFERGTGYFATADETRPLLHTWSLAVEEQFYVFFPLALLFVRRWGAMGTRIALAAATLLSFAFSVWATHAHPALAFYSPASRAWEFLAGALLASNILPAPDRREIGDGAAFIGLGLLGYSVWRVSVDGAFPGVNALPAVLGATLLIYGTQNEDSIARRLLSLKPLVAIGLISYSLYLWHWPLIVFGGYYVIDEQIENKVRIVLALLSFPVAWLSWRYIELPFRKPRLLFSRRTLFIGAAAASLLLATYGAAIYLLNGVPGRFSADVRHLSALGEAPDYGCTSRPLDDVLSETRCRIGDPTAKPSFILWGDSHAAVYFPELRKRAAAHGLAGYNVTTFGCPPLLWMRGPTAPALDDKRNGKMAECRTRNERALRLIADQHLRVVILAAHWGTYTGHRGSKHRVDGSLEADPDGFKAGLAALRHLGVRVYLVLDVPQAERMTMLDLAKARILGRPGGMGPRYADYLRHNGAIRDLAFELQREGLIEVIEPARLLCNAVFCAMTTNDYPLYFDSSHLNARGAAVTGPLFEPMLNSLATPAPLTN